MVAEIADIYKNCLTKTLHLLERGGGLQGLKQRDALTLWLGVRTVHLSLATRSP